jgi:hypothetical protein
MRVWRDRPAPSYFVPRRTKAGAEEVAKDDSPVDEIEKTGSCRASTYLPSPESQHIDSPQTKENK